jgi:hypothetical protein
MWDNYLLSASCKLLHVKGYNQLLLVNPAGGFYPCHQYETMTRTAAVCNN